METSSPGNKSHRLHVEDKISGLTFLVDSGADVSVLPKLKDWRGKPSKFKLYAANQSIINVYKEGIRFVNFEKKKIQDWKFYADVANVPNPILGSDFLVHYYLLPDLTRQILINISDEIFGRGKLLLSDNVSISLIAKPDAINRLLCELPTVIGILVPTPSAKHRVFHHIDTQGPSVTQKTRRLSGK